MQAHHLSISRTARYYTQGPAGADVREVWFVLHGYGQQAADFLRRFEALAAPHRLFVAPEALSRFYLRGTDGRIGASWMTREDRLHEIADYVAYLDALHDCLFEEIQRPDVRVVVLGFSQGAATACRWIAQGRPRADRLLLWGGEVPPDLDLSAQATRLRALDLTLVCGTQDAYVGPERLAAFRERLAQHAVPYRLVTFDGGHRLDDAVLRSLAEAAPS